MSANYDKIKKYYDGGLWSEKRVRSVAEQGFLTEEEVTLILAKNEEKSASVTTTAKKRIKKSKSDT